MLNKYLFLFSAFLIFSVSCKKDQVGKTKPVDDDPLSFRKDMLDVVNQYRVKGCDCGGVYQSPTHPLKWNDTLAQVALIHSKDMAQNNIFKHEGSDGTSADQRIKRTGLKFGFWSENIAFISNYEQKHFSPPEQMVKQWIESTDHCKNIMNPKAKQIGIAVVFGEYDKIKGEYGTQVFTD